ncbi:hypothetical protein FB567DRAFT_533065 [Paraphoma chrysanthemicola]|uniref:Uncharacterized protein n=1 Tax=Paraphoma chrysanthemicola TaxID=798071 RepID=A0A8K0VW19_9PLEO|nr:hypothetical protein FB567DRAFT_533065 [Paraphoma chrysanthemicola]
MALALELGLSAAFTLISLAPMVPEWMKENKGPQIRINVMAGLPALNAEQQKNREQAYEELGFGGCAPDISLFNPNGDRIGFYRNVGCNNDKGNHIKQNSPEDLFTDYIQKDNVEKPEYITVSAAGEDAICISAITVTPPSGEMYAFLPGEMAAVCKEHNPKQDWSWSESAATIQFKNPKTGTTADARPKCLWIDKPKKDGHKMTHYQGFQVHLTDFKYDNSTFKAWDQDPTHMCDSLARFAGYDQLNVMMCPQIFSPAPPGGALLPLPEVSACLPTVVPAEDGKVYPDPCDDPRLQRQDRYNILQMYHYQCPQTSAYDWYWDCPADKKNGCGKPREAEPIIITPRQRPAVSRYNGIVTTNNSLQRRFAGRLVKSRHVDQSAVQVCTNPGSIGPDFFSEHEQMFCDMTERKLYPVCKSGGDMECFDPMYNETRHEGLERREEQHTYMYVHDWF